MLFVQEKGILDGLATFLGTGATHRVDLAVRGVVPPGVKVLGVLNRVDVWCKVFRPHKNDLATFLDGLGRGKLELGLETGNPGQTMPAFRAHPNHQLTAAGIAGVARRSGRSGFSVSTAGW